MTIGQRYKVILKNQSGVNVAEFDSWFGLQMAQKVNVPGSYELVISGNDPRTTLFETDGQIEIWRRDIIGGLPWYLEFEGFHREEERETLDNGQRLFRSRGVSYEDLLARRIVAYFAGSNQSRKSGPAEQIMAEFVRENCGVGAVSPPRLANGVIPGLTVAPTFGTGPVWEGQRTWKNVLKVVEEIALFAEIDYSVRGTSPLGGPPSWEFKTFFNQLGADRTTTGLDPATGLNAAGNTPIIFSVGFGNMLTPKYIFSRIQEVNALFSLGEGEGSGRDIIEVSNPSAIASSPYNRRESSRNGSNQISLSELADFGIEWLEKLQAKETFTMQVQQNKATFYGRGSLDNIYWLGDRVTLRYDEIERNKRITASTISVDGKQVEQIKLDFTDVP